MPYSLACIILAAGKSSRMQLGNKLLLKINDKTILEKTLENIIENALSSIYVVLGYQNDLIRKLIKNKKVTAVINNEFKKGISTSIVKGIQKLNKDVDGVLICLADMPKINKNIYKEIIYSFHKNYKNNIPLIIVPEFNKKIGNPMIFSKYFFSKLKDLKGDKGAKNLINEFNKYVIKIEVINGSIFEDIDDEKAYNKYLNDETK